MPRVGANEFVYGNCKCAGNDVKILKFVLLLEWMLNVALTSRWNASSYVPLPISM